MSDLFFSMLSLDPVFISSMLKLSFSLTDALLGPLDFISLERLQLCQLLILLVFLIFNLFLQQYYLRSQTDLKVLASELMVLKLQF